MPYMKNVVTFFLFLVFSFQAFGLESITIPNALCGNGSPYKIFIDKQSNEKLMVEFMGGGACWDFESCFILPHTWIFPIPNISSLSLFTDNSADLNFLKGHSKIYFPYCTGDIHAGNHIGLYANNSKVYHYGARNILLSLAYLKAMKIISFESINDLVVWGASAGALATMIHSKTIERMVTRSAHKTMIIDSPGLHWGKNFWDKFPSETIKDFDNMFIPLNIKLTFKDGFIAKDMTNLFLTYKDWNIGFLFGTKDLIMSSVFGDISPGDQEHLILSNYGMPQISRNFPNANIWIKDTYMHTFLLLSTSAQFESFDGITAIDFARSVYQK